MAKQSSAPTGRTLGEEIVGMEDLAMELPDLALALIMMMSSDMAPSEKVMAPFQSVASVLYDKAADMQRTWERLNDLSQGSRS